MLEFTLSFEDERRGRDFLEFVHDAVERGDIDIHHGEFSQRHLDVENQFCLVLHKLRTTDGVNFSIPANSVNDPSETALIDVKSGHWQWNSGHVITRDEASASLNQGRGYCKGFEDGVEAAMLMSAGRDR